jgi:hypothetical protein
MYYSTPRSYHLALAGMVNAFVTDDSVSSSPDVILLFYCESPTAIHLVDNSTPTKYLQLLDSLVVCQ